jgi:putative heme iron utilization protein
MRKSIRNTMSADEARFEAARQLWAGRFQGVIATQSLAEPGYAFPSVVPYCLNSQGHALMLLSHLAQHTKNLEVDPRCGFSVAEATDADVQQSLRLACTADVAPVDPDDLTSHARFFRYFPASRTYLEQLNFRLYRLSPRRFHVNGGFATARWLGSERVLRESPLDASQESQLLAALAQALAADSAASMAPDSQARRFAGIDPWGLDIGHGERLYRIPLAGPLTTLEDLVSRAADALGAIPGGPLGDP